MRYAYLKNKKSKELYKVNSINYDYVISKDYELYILENIYISDNHNSINELKKFNNDLKIICTIPLTDISFTSRTISFIKHYAKKYFNCITEEE